MLDLADHFRGSLGVGHVGGYGGGAPPGGLDEPERFVEFVLGAGDQAYGVSGAGEAEG